MSFTNRLKSAFAIAAASALMALLQGCGNWLASPQPKNQAETTPTPAPTPPSYYLVKLSPTDSSMSLTNYNFNILSTKGNATTNSLKLIPDGNGQDLQISVLSPGDEVYATLDFGTPFVVLQVHFFVDETQCPSHVVFEMPPIIPETCGPNEITQSFGGGTNGINVTY